MSILEITAIVGAMAAVVSAATMVGPAVVKRWRKWALQRDQDRCKWNTLEVTVEINGSDEYFYQLTNESGTRVRERLRRSNTALRRGNLLVLAETERPAHLTLSTGRGGTIVLQTGWRRRNIRPGNTCELREGFGEARIYMKKAKRANELPAPET